MSLGVGPLLPPHLMQAFLLNSIYTSISARQVSRYSPGFYLPSLFRHDGISHATMYCFKRVLRI